MARALVNKNSNPGDLYNMNLKKKAMKHKKSGLRPASAVVADEQNSSHQYYKKKSKMTNIGIKNGGKGGKTNIGVMRQTTKQTNARKNKKKAKGVCKMCGK